MPPDGNPDVHVAIVNWNTARSALRCAEAYLACSDVRVRVTIVDNASEASEAALLRAGAHDRIELRMQSRNMGYGAAANDALRDSETALVCVSNADLLPSADMLAQLAREALRDRSAGLVAPRLLGSAGRYHARLPLGPTLPLRAFAGSFGHRTVPDPPAGTVAEVQQPAGACLLVRTEVWRELGGFDPGFFLWFEDVDLARRSLNAGYRNLVVGSAVAQHTGAEAFARLDEGTRQRIRMHSLQRYVDKHHPRASGATRAAVAIATPLRVRGARGGRPATPLRAQDACRRPGSPQQPADLDQLQCVGDEEACGGAGGEAGDADRGLECDGGEHQRSRADRLVEQVQPRVPAEDQ